MQHCLLVSMVIWKHIVMQIPRHMCTLINKDKEILKQTLHDLYGDILFMSNKAFLNFREAIQPSHQGGLTSTKPGVGILSSKWL